jgi:TPR repeat protein
MGRDDAFFFLGIAYYEGRGVQASIPKAEKFFKRANIDSDHVAADKMLSKLRP